MSKATAAQAESFGKENFAALLDESFGGGGNIEGTVLRGRIIGIYFYAFNGTGPLGGLLAGWLCATGGTELAFVVAGILGLVATGVAAQNLGPVDWRLRARAQPVRGQGRSHLATTHHQSS